MTLPEAIRVLLTVAKREERKLIASEGYLVTGGAYRPMAGKHRNRQLEDLRRAIRVAEPHAVRDSNTKS